MIAAKKRRLLTYYVKAPTSVRLTRIKTHEEEKTLNAQPQLKQSIKKTKERNSDFQSVTSCVCHERTVYLNMGDQ